MTEVFYIIELSCLFTVLAVATWQDVRTRKIKNEINVAGVALGLLTSLLPDGRSFFSAVLGFLVALAFGIVFWCMKLFHAGDAKLLCVVGAFQGWLMALNCLLIAVMIGAAIGLPFLVCRLIKKEKGWTQFPFAVAILLGCLVSTVAGYLWEFF